MAWVLFLLFVALPIAEIAVLIEAGGAIGLWPTIGLIILTAAVGAWLAKAEGRAAMARLSEAVETGGAPAGPLLDAAAIFLGGVLLLTPGFITDALGLSLLFRPTRFLWGQLFVWLRGRKSGPGRARPIVIEGEYIRRDGARPPPDIDDPPAR